MLVEPIKFDSFLLGMVCVRIIMQIFAMEYLPILRSLVRILNVGARKKSFTYENFWKLNKSKIPPHSP